jgi:hypothetical protein
MVNAFTRFLPNHRQSAEPAVVAVTLVESAPAQRQAFALVGRRWLAAALNANDVLTVLAPKRLDPLAHDGGVR